MTGETASQLWDHIVSNIINPIIELLAAAAFVVFIWGVVQFILSLQGGDILVDKKSQSNPGIAGGKRHMIWGIIGLVIIFGAGAIINIIKNTFGLN